ncbi:MAG TPA: type III-B CRISPR module RAMP protein Cmr6 [Pseudonocardiaceae bacterium]|nr:type III-B CRISPR module RAMP protein Cmr6 [Pseudonocardiaceae bacterium]
MTVYGAVSQLPGPTGQHLADLPGRGANADLLMRRLLVHDDNDLTAAQLDAVRRACRNTAALAAGIRTRRRAAVTVLASRAHTTVLAVTITPQWRFVVGHGENSASETSLTLSPTYGTPLLPGSALKGLTVAEARAEKVGDGRLRELFGSPRPGEITSTDRRGSVTFFDALPLDTPELVVDVLTPHAKPYYDQGNRNGVPASPPAEYHNPVPVRFLAVERTRFEALLVGPATDVSDAAGLLVRGLDDLGIGGKTAAGYGYCTATIQEMIA